MKFLVRFIGLLALAMLVLCGLTLTRERDTAAPAREARPYQVNGPALAAAMQDILAANSKLEISVAIADLQTGKRYHYGETASYGSASIGKLVSAIAYLRMVEAGRTSLDDPLESASGREQLNLMIVKSDNSAWHAINKFVTPDRLKDCALSMGLASYDPNDNVLAADDVALLLDKLASYRLLSNGHTDLLLSLMEQANMRNFIVAGAPEGAQIYHKVGYLRDRLHDAAIIRKGSRAYALVIFSKSNGAYDFSKGSTLFQAITQSTTPVFFGD